MLKSAIFLLLAGLTLPVCSQVKKGEAAPASIPTEAGEIPARTPENTGETEEPAGAEFHYAVRFRFTRESAQPLSVTRQAGDMPLTVAPASEMFVATYAGEQLVQYYRFADPLRVRSVGHEGEMERLEEGFATLLFPSTFKTLLAKKPDIAIYSVKAYITGFQEQIATATAVQRAIKAGKLEKTYLIGSTTLGEVLEKGQ